MFAAHTFKSYSSWKGLKTQNFQSGCCIQCRLVSRQNVLLLRKFGSALKMLAAVLSLRTVRIKRNCCLHATFVCLCRHDCPSVSSSIQKLNTRWTFTL